MTNKTPISLIQNNFVSQNLEVGLEEDGIVIPCEVRVFPLLVKRQSKTWPESHQRKCRWFAPEAAVLAIKEESLRELMSSFIETKRRRVKAKART